MSKPVNNDQEVTDDANSSAKVKSVVKLSKISVWSTTLMTFFISILAAVALLLSTIGVWFLFDSIGIFTKIVSTLAPTGNGAELLHLWLGLEKVLVVTGLILATLVVILTVTSFFIAVIFNLTSRLFGGLKITLTN